MSRLTDSIWKWPDGLIWRLTKNVTQASRRRRFNLFMKTVKPKAGDRVVDVGVSSEQGRAVNFFEEWYPYPKQVTAVAIEPQPEFKKRYPKVKLVMADGRKLPFKDNAFDIYFSNAVIEHVGSYSQQKKFLREALRVAPKVFISTPNRWFPIDFHTLVPLAHFLPLPWRNVIYRFFGRSYYASEETLRLTSLCELKKMLPPKVKLRSCPQKLFGLTSNVNIILERT